MVLPVSTHKLLFFSILLTESGNVYYETKSVLRSRKNIIHKCLVHIVILKNVIHDMLKLETITSLHFLLILNGKFREGVKGLMAVWQNWNDNFLSPLLPMSCYGSTFRITFSILKYSTHQFYKNRETYESRQKKVKNHF